MKRIAAGVLLGVCAGCAKRQVQGPPLTQVVPLRGLPPIQIDTRRPGLDVIELPTAETMAATQRTVKVAAEVEATMLERRPVSMGYPAAARQRRLAGHVRFRTVVGPDGIVQGLTLIEASDPVFVPIAKANVESWQYRPYLLNGRAVAVDTTVQVEFSPPQ
jgi:outer membrane biosynthesis protein TonB